MVLILTSLAFFTHCKKNNETRFLVLVDSIQMPDTIQVGDTLDIDMFGTIGVNRCYSLDQIEPVFNDTTITVKVWGKNSGSENCPDGIVYLDNTRLSITNLQHGTYLIVFIQPDDGKLEKPVVVI